MKRYIGCLALLGLLAIPDWASAHYVRQWFAAHTCHPMPPVCCEPPVAYGPVYVVQPAAPPRVIPQAMAERNPPLISKPPVRTNPTIEPVRPVTAAIPEVNVPASIPLPMPMKDVNTLTIPNVSPLPPKVDANPLKLPDANPLKQPDSTLPKFPEDALKLPDATKNAVPTPAPPPDSGSQIPPMFPKLPTLNNDTLPPLVLPPETKGSTSKSSPLSDREESKVQVLAAEGKPAFGATRTVGFFNRTDRDIELVIEGRSVTLPKRTYINAELAPTFRWKQRGEETRTESVPEGAAGLDVVFRE